MLETCPLFPLATTLHTHMLCDLCIPVLGKDTHWLLLLTPMLRRHSVSSHHHRLFCCCLKQDTLRCMHCAILQVHYVFFALGLAFVFSLRFRASM